MEINEWASGWGFGMLSVMNVIIWPRMKWRLSIVTVLTDWDVGMGKSDVLMGILWSSLIEGRESQETRTFHCCTDN